MQWNIDPGQRILFDSGTDFAVLGHCFVPRKIYEDSRIAVNSGVRGDNDLPLYAQLCDADTVVTDLLGKKFILRYHYGINHCDHPLQESLLQPVQIRAGGNQLDDTHLCEPTSNASSQSLVIGKHVIKLLSNGVHVFLCGSKPTHMDYKRGYPILNVTKRAEWSPASLNYKASLAQRQFLTRPSSSNHLIPSAKRRRVYCATVRRRDFVNSKGIVDRLANAGGQRPVEPNHDYNELAACQSYLVPVNELVGHKENRKIWSGTPPMHKFIYINGKYVPFYDPHIDDMTREFSKKTIEHWGKVLGITDERKVAATLRNTTQRILLWESEFPKNFAHSRAPQLNERRLNGIVYTDTAFANFPSIRKAMCFQVFLHMPSGKVHVELMLSKKSLPVALANYSMGHGTPNHLHGDRAKELKEGSCRKYCREKAIRLTHTGEAKKSTQNTHCEHMIGVLKRMTFLFMRRSGVHPCFWDYALLYATVVWNCTSKRRLMNASPDQLFYGETRDISHLRFPFGAAVLYRSASPSFPLADGLSKGVYLGPNVRDGDVFTYYVYDIVTKRVYSRCVVQPDPNTAYGKDYSDYLSCVKFFSDESRLHAIDESITPPEWVPVLIHDGNKAGLLGEPMDTVIPSSQACSKREGGTENEDKCDDGKSTLFSCRRKSVSSVL